MVVGNRHDHLRQPFTVDPGRSRGGVREHIYARHISVGDDPSPGHDVPVGVGVFHLSTGCRILIRVLIGIIPAAVPRPGITVSSIEYIKAGRLRALAVTTATRSELLPDIPTVAEFVA